MLPKTSTTKADPTFISHIPLGLPEPFEEEAEMLDSSKNDDTSFEEEGTPAMAIMHLIPKVVDEERDYSWTPEPTSAKKKQPSKKKNTPPHPSAAAASSSLSAPSVPKGKTKTPRKTTPKSKKGANSTPEPAPAAQAEDLPDMSNALDAIVAPTTIAPPKKGKTNKKTPKKAPKSASPATASVDSFELQTSPGLDENEQGFSRRSRRNVRAPERYNDDEYLVEDHSHPVPINDTPQKGVARRKRKSDPTATETPQSIEPEPKKRKIEETPPLQEIEPSPEKNDDSNGHIKRRLRNHGKNENSAPTPLPVVQNENFLTPLQGMEVIHEEITEDDEKDADYLDPKYRKKKKKAKTANSSKKKQPKTATAQIPVPIQIPIPVEIPIPPPPLENPAMEVEDIPVSQNISPNTAERSKLILKLTSRLQKKEKEMESKTVDGEKDKQPEENAPNVENNEQEPEKEEDKEENKQKKTKRRRIVRRNTTGGKSLPPITPTPTLDFQEQQQNTENVQNSTETEKLNEISQESDKKPEIDVHSSPNIVRAEDIVIGREKQQKTITVTTVKLVGSQLSSPQQKERDDEIAKFFALPDDYNSQPQQQKETGFGKGKGKGKGKLHSAPSGDQSTTDSSSDDENADNKHQHHQSDNDSEESEDDSEDYEYRVNDNEEEEIDEEDKKMDEEIKKELKKENTVGNEPKEQITVVKSQEVEQNSTSSSVVQSQEQEQPQIPQNLPPAQPIPAKKGKKKKASKKKGPGRPKKIGSVENSPNTALLSPDLKKRRGRRTRSEIEADNAAKLKLQQASPNNSSNSKKRVTRKTQAQKKAELEAQLAIQAQQKEIQAQFQAEQLKLQQQQQQAHSTTNKKKKYITKKELEQQLHDLQMQLQQQQQQQQTQTQNVEEKKKTPKETKVKFVVDEKVQKEEEIILSPSQSSMEGELANAQPTGKLKFQSAEDVRFAAEQKKDEYFMKKQGEIEIEEENETNNMEIEPEDDEDDEVIIVEDSKSKVVEVKNEKKATFENGVFPQKVLISIFKFLHSHQVIFSCMRTCRAWRIVGSDQNFWRNQYEKKFHVNYFNLVDVNSITHGNYVQISTNTSNSSNLQKKDGSISGIIAKTFSTSSFLAPNEYDWYDLYFTRRYRLEKIRCPVLQLEYLCKFYRIETDPRIMQCINAKSTQIIKTFSNSVLNSPKTGQDQNAEKPNIPNNNNVLNNFEMSEFVKNGYSLEPHENEKSKLKRETMFKLCRTLFRAQSMEKIE